jgi:hypothetical protein
MPAAVGAAALVVAIVLVVIATRGGGQPASSGTASGPRIGPMASGQTIDGIRCETQEQLVYHIHAHLAIYANGQPRTVPYGIGIPNPQVQQTPDGPFVVAGTCFYWLHSHAQDGIIHIESPVQHTFTLGNWFDIWGQPLNASQVAGDTGTVTAYLNGQRFTGDPRSIPLTAHAVIQLNVGQDVAPQPYTFPQGL